MRLRLAKVEPPTDCNRMIGQPLGRFMDVGLATLILSRGMRRRRNGTAPFLNSDRLNV